MKIHLKSIKFHVNVVKPHALCNMEYPSKMHNKLKSRKVSFPHNLFCSCTSIAKFCTEHGSITAMLCAKFHKSNVKHRKAAYISIRHQIVNTLEVSAPHSIDVCQCPTPTPPPPQPTNESECPHPIFEASINKTNSPLTSEIIRTSSPHHELSAPPPPPRSSWHPHPSKKVLLYLSNIPVKF